MKVVIVHASAGAGHRKASEALRNAFLARELKPDDVQLIDVLDYANAFFEKSYPGVYLFLVRYAPWAWGMCFGFLNNPLVCRMLAPLRHLFNTINVRRFVRYILDAQPDVVVCEHFLSAQLMANFKRRGLFKGLVVTGVTDFGVHRFWINEGTDYYCVASDLTQDELIRKGVSADRIRVTGIPIEEKFSRGLDQKVMREQLGLSPELTTVLVTSGGFGVGPLRRIVDAVDGMPADLQMLVVCGQNKQMYEYLKQADLRKKAAVFGYVHNMDECMAAADVIISKTGGLTVSESLAKNLPMIVIQPIPGQETRNAEVLEAYGAGMRINEPEEVPAVLGKFFADANKQLQIMREQSKKIARPQAAQEMARWISEELFPQN